MLKTFKKGGIHPEESKLTAGKKIRVLPIPEMVHLPVIQHLGMPARPLVKKGDKVKTGQLIAEADGFVSANVHSPVSGMVSKVDLMMDASSYRRMTISIQTEGDEWMVEIDHTPQHKPDINLQPEEILKKIAAAGIVGLGGATFPTHVKLTIPRGRKAESVIINGVECEPFLTSDHALMLEKGPEIFTGIKILMKVLGVDQAFVGIEANKPDAIKLFRDLAMRHIGISIVPLRVKYPQGGEKQLIKAITGREVPSGKLPIDVGTVVVNVGTTFAIYEAVQKNKPLIDRVVTVTGKQLPNPGNFLIRIGTPVEKLIEAAGGIPQNTGKVLYGGPMMGKALPSTDIPAGKGCSGILAIPIDESRRRDMKVCIRCAKCVQACPMGLEPYLLMAMSERGYFDRMENERVMDCIECGSCSYICPSDRPLLDYIRLGKSEVNRIIRSRK